MPSASIDLNQMRVFMFKNLTISGTVKVPASVTALALVADGEIVIDGVLDVSADGQDPGPGSTAGSACNGTAPMFAAGPTPGGGAVATAAK